MRNLFAGFGDKVKSRKLAEGCVGDKCIEKTKNYNECRTNFDCEHQCSLYCPKPNVLCYTKESRCMCDMAIVAPCKLH